MKTLIADHGESQPWTLLNLKDKSFLQKILFFYHLNKHWSSLRDQIKVWLHLVFFDKFNIGNSKIFFCLQYQRGFTWCNMENRKGCKIFEGSGKVGRCNPTLMLFCKIAEILCSSGFKFKEFDPKMHFYLVCICSLMEHYSKGQLTNCLVSCSSLNLR